MGKKDNNRPPEPGPPTNGWVISFSDCMTNLLCFFVLLVSFSSFDTDAQSKIQGAFTSMSAPGLSDRMTEPTDAIVPPKERPFDHTDKGAEKPTDHPPEVVRKPLHEEVPNIKAFHDQVIIRIPASRLFYGSGDLLTPFGRKNLKLIGSYMRLLPVRAVVCQRGAVSGQSEDSGLKRAWAVVACVSKQAAVNQDRFCITCGKDGASLGEPVVEICLLRGEVAQ